MKEPTPKPMSGYKYAVISCVVQETVGDKTTEMARAWLIPMGMSFRDAMTNIIGETNTLPEGRFTLSVPEELPFDPKKPGHA